jgi:hypothetical protein
MQGWCNSTAESNGCLDWHNFSGSTFCTPIPFFFAFYWVKINLSQNFIILWLLIGSNLNVLCSSENEIVLRITTSITVLVTVSGNFMLLIMTKFWESWSVFTDGRGGLNYCLEWHLISYLEWHLNLCQPCIIVWHLLYLPRIEECFIIGKFIMKSYDVFLLE